MLVLIRGAYGINKSLSELHEATCTHMVESKLGQDM